MALLNKMKPLALIFLMVLSVCQRASQAFDNPFVLKPEAENVLGLEKSAFVKGAPDIGRQFARAPMEDDEKRIDSLGQLISMHREEQRIQIENLMKQGNILKPGPMSGGLGPKCNLCFGTSLKSCLSSKKEKQCERAERCYTVHLITRATGQQTFVKGCISTAICQSDVCKKIHDTSEGEYSFCKAACCKGRLCNGGSGHNGGTTQKPSGTTSPVKPSANGPKCYSCQGSNLASCASHMTLKQCLPEYQCADAYLVTMPKGKSLVAKGCIPSKLCQSGLCRQLNSTGRYSQCRSSCCGSDQCNAITTLPTTQGASTVTRPSTTEKHTRTSGPSEETTPPFFTQTTSKGNTEEITPLPSKPPLPSIEPTTKSGYLCYSCNSQTAQECSSNINLHKCDIGKVCFTGRATRNNGVTMFAKGCMRTEQCATSCKRLSLTTKDCKVDCCHGDYCNQFSLTTERPTEPQRSCYRILLQVLEVLKKLLETVDTLIKSNALTKAAPLYKREINSLMGKMNTHAFQLTEKDGPAIRHTVTRMRSLRKRAGKVVKRLDEIIAKR